MGHSVTTLKVNTIEPAGSTLTLGASGDSIVIADDVKSNTYKDAGGNTLFVSNGSGVLSSVNSGFGDALKLLSTQTASSSASISFTSGLDSTYKEYIFKFINIHTATDTTQFQFQCNASGQSGYNETVTSTWFRPYHQEGGGSAGLEYEANMDQAQGTGFISLSNQQGTDNDQGSSGELHIFNPSSTTFVKHFYSRMSNAAADNSSRDVFVAGYINVTAAITQIQFKAASGNIDAGKIKMYGVA